MGSLGVKFPLACVAASIFFAISACGGNNEPPIAVHTDGIDLLMEKSTGKPLEAAMPMAGIFGVDSILEPSPSTAKEIIGVSALAENCVVIYYGGKDTIALKTMPVLVQSRFNKTLNVLYANPKFEVIPTIINKLKPICSGDTAIPSSTDLAKFAADEEPTTTT